MQISKLLSDELILAEIGERITRSRLELSVTQAQLAEQAGDIAFYRALPVFLAGTGTYARPGWIAHHSTGTGFEFAGGNRRGDWPWPVARWTQRALGGVDTDRDRLGCHAVSRSGPVFCRAIFSAKRVRSAGVQAPAL